MRVSFLLGGFEDKGAMEVQARCVVSGRAIFNDCCSESVHLVCEEVYSSASFNDGGIEAWTPG